MLLDPVAALKAPARGLCSTLKDQQLQFLALLFASNFFLCRFRGYPRMLEGQRGSALALKRAKFLGEGYVQEIFFLPPAHRS